MDAQGDIHMPTVFDVKSDLLLKRASDYFKQSTILQPMPYLQYVKSGSHTTHQPINQDWWYIRAASLLRKVYTKGPISLKELEKEYGGRKRIGYRIAHHRDAGSSIIRKLLIQLQAANLVTKTPKGRIITPEGRSLMDKLSAQVFEEMKKEDESLKKFEI
ncbi:MAG: 30S ribosomal protein S19e [Nitrososphaerota archaeon]|nr:30S ribosomal protein S19e [Nitrososphaerota archaeon]